jgi:hypothetical protein
MFSFTWDKEWEFKYIESSIQIDSSGMPQNVELFAYQISTLLLE